MRNYFSYLALMSGVLLTSACSFSLPESSNPDTKLQMARDYQNKQQALPAERLLMEAMKEYELNENTEGLAESYREFGLFLKSPQVTAKEQTYRSAGFLNTSISFDNRIEKGNEYLALANEQYQKALTRAQSQKQYDKLPMLYYKQAQTYQQLGNTQQACASYDKSREAFAENAVRGFAASSIPEGYSSFDEAIRTAKYSAHCF